MLIRITFFFVLSHAVSARIPFLSVPRHDMHKSQGSSKGDVPHTARVHQLSHQGQGFPPPAADDHSAYMKNFQPLNDLEMESIRKAQQAIEEDKSIPCTVCHYCTKGCPQSIPIPEIFAVENRKKGSPHFRTVREYNIVTQGLGRAGDCIQCGQCESPVQPAYIFFRK